MARRDRDDYRTNDPYGYGSSGSQNSGYGQDYGSRYSNYDSASGSGGYGYRDARDAEYGGQQRSSASGYSRNSYASSYDGGSYGGSGYGGGSSYGGSYGGSSGYGGSGYGGSYGGSSGYSGGSSGYGGSGYSGGSSGYGGDSGGPGYGSPSDYGSYGGQYDDRSYDDGHSTYSRSSYGGSSRGPSYEDGDYDVSDKGGRSSRSSRSPRQSRSQSRYNNAVVYDDTYDAHDDPAYGAIQSGSRTSARSGSANRQQNTRAGGAAGVNKVAAKHDKPAGYVRRSEPGASRRQFIVAGASAAAALAAVGLVGVGWWTHRAVACTVNGTKREIPINSTASDIINRGYANPARGNLVSISKEGETPQVLTPGGGNSYTMTVNGEPVDVESYRLAEDDVVEFFNGTDQVEQTRQDITILPCKIQFPDDSEYLAVVGYVKQWGCDGKSMIETGLVSGKTIDRGVVEEPRDLIIATGRINPADGRRLVALTFDDGPSKVYTPQYLDILAQYGARATFFNLGSEIDSGEDYHAIMRRCVEEGHQVASHTYSHDEITLTGMDLETRNWEIRRTFELVSKVTGVPTQVMRPPYGELRGRGFLQYMASGGDISYSAFWSVDSNDWEMEGVDALIEQCTRGLSGDNYNGAVILMHDGGGNRDQDVQALPAIIERFQAEGYELVTMNEMLAADPTYPAWVTSGYVSRPEGAIVPDITPYM